MKLFIPSRRAAVLEPRVPREITHPVENACAESLPDEVLLQRYARSRSEDAFAQIVCRHAGWVYAVCRRSLRDVHLAEDAAQAVFLLLARKAVTIRPQKHLAGWLFQACRYVLADLRKHRTRYEQRQELARDLALHRTCDSDQVQSPSDSDTCAALDEAIASLGEADRQAILMRFYEAMTVEQIATQLGIGREAAKKRVTRALSRLRRLLAGRLNFPAAGKRIALPLAGLALLLRAGATEAAPAGLAAAIAKAATVPGLASTLATMVVEGVRQATLHATSRLLVALAATAAPVAVVISVTQPPREAPPTRTTAATTPPLPRQAPKSEYPTAMVAGPGRAIGRWPRVVDWRQVAPPAPVFRDRTGGVTSPALESRHTPPSTPLPPDQSAIAAASNAPKIAVPRLAAVPASAKRAIASPRPPQFAVASPSAEWPAEAKQSPADASPHDADPSSSEKRGPQPPKIDAIASRPHLDQFPSHPPHFSPDGSWPADPPWGRAIEHPSLALQEAMTLGARMHPGGPPHRAEHMLSELLDDRLPPVFPFDEKQEPFARWQDPIPGGPPLRGLFAPSEHARFAAAGRANQPDEFDPFGSHCRWTAPDRLDSPFLLSIPDQPASNSPALTIVPEPSATATILLVVGSLLLRRRRRLSPTRP